MKIVLIENLRMRWSPVGKVLRHLKAIRCHTQSLRANLVALKSLDDLWASDFKSDSPYKALIEAYEESITSNEKEMEGIRKALESALRAQRQE